MALEAAPSKHHSPNANRGINQETRTIVHQVVREHIEEFISYTEEKSIGNSNGSCKSRES
jgi:hypothetical protein